MQYMHMPLGGGALVGRRATWPSLCASVWREQWLTAAGKINQKIKRSMKHDGSTSYSAETLLS